MKTECPYCKQATGYQIVFWTKYTQWTHWDGTPEGAEDCDSKGGSIGECMDCGRRFRVSKLEKSNGK